MKINQTIISPVLTEKATDAAKTKTYSFVVHSKANKSQIRLSLEKIYQVKVGEIRIIVRKGKERRIGKKMKTVRQHDKKIAMVKIKEGKIDIFPQT